MRVLFLADADSIHTQKLALALKSSNIDIKIFSLNHSKFDYETEGIEVFYPIKSTLNSKEQSFAKALRYLSCIYQLRKIIKKFKPNFLHAHYISSYGLLALLSGYKNYDLSVWGSDIFIFPNKSRFHLLLTKYVLKKASRVISTSFAMQNETQKIIKREIEVIPFGIDTNIFRPTTKPFQNETIKIGIAKGLENIYGIDILIKVFHKLQTSLPEVKTKLIIAGTGPDKNEYLNLVSKFNLTKKVEFLGKISNKAVADFYNSIDIAVFPSRSESFGVSAIEAMACDRTSIVSNVGGLPEVTNYGKNAYIASSEDEILSILINVINNKEIKSNYTYVCDTYSEDITKTKYINLYKYTDKEID